MAAELWVARAPLIEQARPCAAWLTDEERAICDGRVFARHRDEYLLTRVVCRAVLGRLTGRDPAALRFVRTPEGRPELVDGGELRFNLSNTNGHVVLLVATGLEVGVDVEALTRAPEIVKLAPSVFSTREQTELATLTGEAQHERAVALWTLKESYIKARGLGLQLPLDRFSFGFDGEPPTVAIDPELADDGRAWQFRRWPLDELRVATAVRHPSPVAIDPRDAATLF